MSPNFHDKTPYREDENNFKIAKAMSYDLSGDFLNYSPRLEGRVQACLIGDPDLVEFEIQESNIEEEESEEEDEGNADEVETSSDSSSEEDKWNLNENKSGDNTSQIVE